MPCFNCTSRALRIFLHDSLIPSLQSLQQRQSLKLQVHRPVPLISTYPRLSSHFSTVRRQIQSSFAGADGLTDDDYVPFVLPSTFTHLEADKSASRTLHVVNKDKFLMHNRTGWPPPVPKVATEQSVDGWDGEPHIEHTEQLDVGEFSTGWGALEGMEEELLVTSANESGDISGQTLSNLPQSGGALRKVGKRPVVAAKKEKVRLEKLNKPVLSEEEEAAKWAAAEEERAIRWEKRWLEKASKSKAAREERDARKESKRLEKLAELAATGEVNTTKGERRLAALAAAGELKAAKKKKRRLEQRAKWAAVEEAAKEAGVTGEEQGQVEEGQYKDNAKLAGDVEVTREEGQGQAENLLCETNMGADTATGAEAGAKAKKHRKAGGRRARWWSEVLAYKASNRKSRIRRPHSPAFKEARPPISQPPEASTANPDPVTPYKKTHRGRRALPATRRPSHFPPRQNSYRGRRSPPPTQIFYPPRERKPRDPSLKYDLWNLSVPTFDVEPTRLQQYIASRPRNEVERWMVEKANLQKKFQGAKWEPKKKLSPAALDGIRALHKSHPEYTTEKLSQLFEVDPEAIKRVLKSNWERDAATDEARMEHWAKRGVRVYRRWEKLGVVQTKKSKKQVRDRRKEREAKWGLQENMNNTKVSIAAVAGRIV